MTIGKRIQQLRQANGISTTGLAAMLDRTESAVRMWESDKAYPTVQTLITLSDMFHVSTDYLLKGDVGTHQNDGLSAICLMQIYCRLKALSAEFGIMQKRHTDENIAAMNGFKDTICATLGDDIRLI